MNLNVNLKYNLIFFIGMIHFLDKFNCLIQIWYLFNSITHHSFVWWSGFPAFLLKKREYEKKRKGNDEKWMPDLDSAG